MNSKSMILFMVAIGCGLVAMLGVQQVLSKNNNKPKEGVVKVLVAQADIHPGVPVNETNTKFVDWPKNRVPENAVTQKEQYEERSLRTSAVPGDVITLTKLGAKGVLGGSNEIPKGMRVATVKVDQTKTHSGVISPGDRVDVVLIYTQSGRGSNRISKAKMILEYIEVFQTDDLRKSAVAASGAKEVKSKNISLLVDPKQYNLLALASSAGTISLSLRSPEDDEIYNKDLSIDITEFDDSLVSAGIENGLDEMLESENENSNLSDFLNESEGNELTENKEVTETKKQVETPAPVVVVQKPAKPKWKMTIYSGEVVQEVEVDTDEENPVSNVSETHPKSASNHSRKPSWSGWVQGILTGA